MKTVEICLIVFHIIEYTKTMKKEGLMTRDFKYDTSRICWSLFEKTGGVGYYQLFKEVEFGKNLDLEQDSGR